MSDPGRARRIVDREVSEALSIWESAIWSIGIDPYALQDADMIADLRSSAIARLRALVPRVVPRSVPLTSATVQVDRSSASLRWRVLLPAKLELLLARGEAALRPRFENLCDRCRFLGHEGGRDMHFCDGRGRDEVVLMGPDGYRLVGEPPPYDPGLERATLASMASGMRVDPLVLGGILARQDGLMR